LLAQRPRERRPPLRIVKQAASVLVAGADAGRRAALLGELANTMPDGTAFAEASTLSEVLEQAPRARMVILSGWLEDGSPLSLTRALGQRHPTLPVITVDGPRPHRV
jgi:DNA-binding NtrC family response regulator